MVATIVGAQGVSPVIASELPTLSWVDVNSNVLFLSAPNNGVIYMPGATGLDLPPMAFLSATAPALDGQLLRGVRADIRVITIPLYVEADTRANLRAKIRAMAGQFDPRSGDGMLRLQESDGTLRQITCRYSDGMLGDENVSAAGLHWRMMVLTFQAFNPFWSDAASIAQSWPLGASHNFFPFLLPLILTPSAVLGAVTITNGGDEPAYPLWTITGPMTAVTLTNNTTGQAFTITRTLTAGHSITVNCDPSQLTIVDDLAANMWPYVGAAPVLWALKPGDNSVNLTLTGASAGSNVALQYTRRWKTS